MFARRRPLLRAAAVGGGAYLAGKARQRRLGEREQHEEDQDARVSDHEQSQAGPQPAAAGQPAASVPEQLGQLTELHDKGALTDAEFATAKSRLLGL